MIQNDEISSDAIAQSNREWLERTQAWEQQQRAYNIARLKMFTKYIARAMTGHAQCLADAKQTKEVKFKVIYLELAKGWRQMYVENSNNLARVINEISTGY